MVNLGRRAYVVGGRSGGERTGKGPGSLDTRQNGNSYDEGPRRVEARKPSCLITPGSYPTSDRVPTW